MSTRIVFEGVVETKLVGRATKPDVERFLAEFDALRLDAPVLRIFDALGLTGYAVECVPTASAGFFNRRDRVARIQAVTTHAGVRMAAIAMSVTTTPVGLPILVCDTLDEAYRKAHEFVQARRVS